MKKLNAIVLQYEEFEALINEVSGGHAGIGFGSREWFYTADDEYDCDNIKKDLSNHLDVTVLAVRMDTSAEQDEVVIICE